jgi:hypothetical protein
MGGERYTLLDPLERPNSDLSKGLERVDDSSPHLRTETDPVSERLCFPVSRISDDGQSLKKTVFLAHNYCPSSRRCPRLSS